MAAALRSPPPADLVLPAAAQIERAWHLLTVLIRLGRPAPAAELAAKWALSSIPSPDLVEFLCRIPGSPLFLTDDGFVTVSEDAVAVLWKFLVRPIATFMPRFVFRIAEQRRIWSEISVIYERKRKKQDFRDDLVVETPRAKRRLLLPLGRNVEEFRKYEADSNVFSTVNLIQGAIREVHFDIDNDLNNDNLSAATSTKKFASRILPPLDPYLAQLSPEVCKSCPSKHYKNENVCKNIQGIVALAALPHFPDNRDDCFDDVINGNITKATDPVKLLIAEPESDTVCQDIMPYMPIKHETDTNRSRERCAQVTVHMPMEKDLNLADGDMTGSRMESDILMNKVALNTGCSPRPIKDRQTSAAICCQEEASIEIKASKNAHEESASIGPKLEQYLVDLSAKPSIVINRRKSSMKARIMEERGSTVGLQNYKALLNQRDYGFLEKKQDNNDCRMPFIEQKIKRNYGYMPAKEHKEDAIPKAANNLLEPKLMPNFESFVIEEEEGSGGYGTVYKVRRKLDDKVFAVKCPHANAQSYHVSNEMKMLERLGGRNFVIKYEGSFKSGDNECFVLEHVEHDRPEILKKEITVFELQWYGYCMFKALASLHKQGIVHRDIKPGNFLFSRKLNKGYLIDFNLANDLHQKFFKKSKVQADRNMSLDQVSLSNEKLPSNNQRRRAIDSGVLDSAGKEAVNGSKKHLISRSTRKRSNRNPLETLPNLENKNRGGSQAADVSGITSAKDPTSTRTPSADILKQPIPCKGRKELINFLHEAMQSPNQNSPTVPPYQRKRIAAPLAKVDKKLLILSPMPLHYRGNAVAGAGMLRDRGKGKQKREGPCVGTKGFRAPEVLLKSFHQGCKLDIWSAGVTLLYLMMGRTPFGGDPEQNIKEIAKLRGSEDLWEVAKLHDSESSYPPELFDVSSLKPTELREWCAHNTRRPDFLDAIPPSLLDLVDKCLTVNPRRRITAEEALMHEFFAPCHESLRKQRMLRRTADSVSGMPSS